MKLDFQINLILNYEIEKKINLKKQQKKTRVNQGSPNELMIYVMRPR
jgi:hypothetical protein